jgi:hypothetical protein
LIFIGNPTRCGAMALLEVRDLRVWFPVFGGLLRRKVDDVKAVDESVSRSRAVRPLDWWGKRQRQDDGWPSLAKAFEGHDGGGRL